MAQCHNDLICLCLVTRSPNFLIIVFVRRNPCSTERDSSQSLWLLALIWTEGFLALPQSSHSGIPFHYNPRLDPLLLGAYDFLLLGFSLFCLSNSFKNSLWVVNGLCSCMFENVTLLIDILARYRSLGSKTFFPQHFADMLPVFCFVFSYHLELPMTCPLSTGFSFFFEWLILLAFRIFPPFLVSKMSQEYVMGWVCSFIFCIL